MQVVDLPAEDPTIEGLKLKYRIGEVLKANCTSGESAPATNLTWFVNGRRTEEQKAYHQHRITRKGRHMERHVLVYKLCNFTCWLFELNLTVLLVHERNVEISYLCEMLEHEFLRVISAWRRCCFIFCDMS